MIAVSNFVLLPLVFLSSVFMAQALMPGWMQGVAKYNPVNWAVEAGREGLAAGPGLEPRLHAHGLARGLHRPLHVAGDARLPRVPEVDLTEAPGDAPRTGRQDESGGPGLMARPARSRLPLAPAG